MKTQLRVRATVRAGGVTIYGTDWCGYTTRQKAAFDAKGIPYEYINCEDGKCPATVKAYPTVSWTGFQEI